MTEDPEDLICECGGPKSRKAHRCATCARSGHTAEQRDQHALCGARKKNGQPCRAFAGQNTGHKGIGPCWVHGGSTTSHHKHAAEVEARRRMVTLGGPVENITAPEALMGLLRGSSGHVAWLAREVAALDTLASHEASVLVKLYDSERDRLTRISESCVRAGVAEHIVRMEQAQAATTVQAIRDAARDAGLNSTQTQALGVALRKRLAEASGEPDEDAEQRLAELRADLAADEERRVTSIAERRARQLSGLTFPPEELCPAEPDAAA